MKRIKACFAVATLALCLNAPSLLTSSAVAGNSRSSTTTVSHAVIPDQRPAYAAVLGQGVGIEGQIAIGVALALAATAIAVTTGGAALVVAPVLGAF